MAPLDIQRIGSRLAAVLPAAADQCTSWCMHALAARLPCHRGAPCATDRHQLPFGLHTSVYIELIATTEHLLHAPAVGGREWHMWGGGARPARRRSTQRMQRDDASRTEPKGQPATQVSAACITHLNRCGTHLTYRELAGCCRRHPSLFWQLGTHVQPRLSGKSNQTLTQAFVWSIAGVLPSRRQAGFVQGRVPREGWTAGEREVEGAHQNPGGHSINRFELISFQFSIELHAHGCVPRPMVQHPSAYAAQAPHMLSRARCNFV